MIKKTNTKKIFLLLLFNVIVYFFFNYAHPVTPKLMGVHKFPDYANGLAYSFMSIGQFFSSSFWGKTLKRKSVLILMVVSVVGYGLSQQLFALSFNIPVMAIARILSGIFASGWIIVSYELVNININPKEKTKYFGYVLMTTSLAAILGQISSGIIGDKFGIYIPFYIQTLGLIIVAVLIPFFLKSTKKEDQDIQDDISQHDEYEIIQKISFKRIMKDKSFPILVVSTLLSLALTAYTNQFTYYIGKTQGGNALEVGMINGYTNLITMILNIYIVYRFENKFGTLKAISYNIIISLTGITFFMIAMQDGNVKFGSVIIPITLLLFGLGMYLPITQKYAVNVTKFESSIILGYTNAAKSLGMVLGSMIAGLLYGFGFEYVLGLIFVSLLTSLIIMSMYKKKVNQTKNS